MCSLERTCLAIIVTGMLFGNAELSRMDGSCSVALPLVPPVIVKKLVVSYFLESPG